MAVQDAFPIWAERQRSAIRNPESKVTLVSLIVDLADEARNKDKKASSALYGGKPDSKGSKGNKGNKGGNKKDKKDKKDDKPKPNPKSHFCKHCKDPEAKHEDEDCFVVNKKGREWFKKKYDKKYVLFYEKIEKNKDKEDSDLDNEKPQKFKKNRLYVVLTANSNRRRTLFNSGLD